MAEHMRGDSCQHSKLPARILLGLALLFLPSTVQALALEEKPSGEKDVTVFMVVRVNGRSASQIEETFMDGAQACGESLSKGDLQVRPVAPAFYEAVASYIGAGAPVTAESVKGVQVTPLMSLRPTWSINFGDDITKQRIIQKITLKLKDQAEPVELKPGVRQGDNFLSTIQIGREYVLGLQNKAEPESYSIDYLIPESGETSSEKDLPWPKPSDAYFLVTLKNYPGELESLFSAMKEPDSGKEAKVANPFKDIRRDLDVRMFLGSINTTLPEPPVTVVGNKLTMRQSQLQGRTAKRVWVLFPVTNDGLKEEVEKLTKNSDDMAGFIRANCMMADKDASVSGTTKPTWYELPANEAKSSFERTLTLQDWKSLQESYPEANQIVVWEFESNGDAKPKPILVQDGGKESPFKVSEIDGWPSGLEVLKKFEQSKDNPNGNPVPNENTKPE